VSDDIDNFENRYEYVHHLPDCPSVGGNGDEDCNCGAVAFLKSLDALAARPADAEHDIAVEAMVRCARVAAGLETALAFISRPLLDTAVRESIKELRRA
jgi:hypothetical protein